MPKIVHDKPCYSFLAVGLIGVLVHLWVPVDSDYGVFAGIFLGRSAIVMMVFGVAGLCHLVGSCFRPESDSASPQTLCFLGALVAAVVATFI